MAGISTLVGSGATAILSSVYWNDVAGGFAIGQYILGAGAVAITCVLQIHGKTCACWTKWVTNLSRSISHRSTTLPLTASLTLFCECSIVHSPAKYALAWRCNTHIMGLPFRARLRRQAHRVVIRLKVDTELNPARREWSIAVGAASLRQIRSEKEMTWLRDTFWTISLYHLYPASRRDLYISCSPGADPKYTQSTIIQECCSADHWLWEAIPLYSLAALYLSGQRARQVDHAMPRSHPNLQNSIGRHRKSMNDYVFHRRKAACTIHYFPYRS